MIDTTFVVTNSSIKCLEMIDFWFLDSGTPALLPTLVPSSVTI